MNLMDITKKFATPEAFVQFLEGIGWRSIVVWNCCCPVDNRQRISGKLRRKFMSVPGLRVYPPTIPKTLKHPCAACLGAPDNKPYFSRRWKWNRRRHGGFVIFCLILKDLVFKDRRNHGGLRS